MQSSLQVLLTRVGIACLQVRQRLFQPSLHTIHKGRRRVSIRHVGDDVCRGLRKRRSGLHAGLFAWARHRPVAAAGGVAGRRLGRGASHGGDRLLGGGWQGLLSAGLRGRLGDGGLRLGAFRRLHAAWHDLRDGCWRRRRREQCRDTGHDERLGRGVQSAGQRLAALCECPSAHLPPLPLAKPLRGACGGAETRVALDLSIGVLFLVGPGAKLELFDLR
mmetsp:Transcript_68734/g.223794  ORF Transcript_68734/g.223794 Transcript_68734/m.223794 type:complete len:219 (-) Transcript_68734:550-1206(-)